MYHQFYGYFSGTLLTDVFVPSCHQSDPMGHRTILKLLYGRHYTRLSCRLSVYSTVLPGSIESLDLSSRLQLEITINCVELLYF